MRSTFIINTPSTVYNSLALVFIIVIIYSFSFKIVERPLLIFLWLYCIYLCNRNLIRDSQSEYFNAYSKQRVEDRDSIVSIPLPRKSELSGIVFKSMFSELSEGFMLSSNNPCWWTGGRPFFFLILKGHHHKRSMKPISVAQAKLIDFFWSKWRYSAIFSSQLYFLRHLHWLSIVCQFWKVNFLKHGCVRPSCMGKGNSGLSYSRIGEIPVSHFLETKKCQKVNLIGVYILVWKLYLFLPPSENYIFHPLATSRFLTSIMAFSP